MIEVLDAAALVQTLHAPDLLATRLDRPVLVVEVATILRLEPARAEHLALLLADAPVLVVGLASRGADASDPETTGDGVGAAVAACTTVVDDADLELVVAGVSACPRAALVLDRVLRAGPSRSVPAGLELEAFAYSTLLGGAEFRRWLAGARRSGAPPSGPAVRTRRAGDRLEIELAHPEHHNAFGAAMRDALCEAIEIAQWDPSIGEIVLSGAGPSFSSGGARYEFGTAADPAEAAAIRIARSVGARLVRTDADVVCHVHGACIGAGIEIAAFADRVIAAPDTYARLPELAMGLIPGAGGTVSLPARIGRQRSAWMALTGKTVDVATMHAWGLVDVVR